MKRNAEFFDNNKTAKKQKKQDALNIICTKVVNMDVYFEASSEADIIAQLQDNAIDVNMIDNQGVTLYMYSAIKGYLNLFHYLDSNIGVEKALLNRRRQTILHCAAEGGNINILCELLKNCLNPNIRDTFNVSPFDSAVTKGHIEATRLFLDDPRIDPAADNNHAIIGAAINGRTDIIRLLLADRRVDPAASNNIAISSAACNGHTEAVRLLLADPRVDPSDKDVIFEPVENGHIEVVRLLLTDPRVDPSVKNNQVLREAARRDNIEIARLLLTDPRVDPSVNDNRVIKWICSKGYTELFKLLLSHPRFDSVANNELAICEAVWYGRTELVKLLMENKAVNSNIDYNALAKIALDREHNNLYAILESYNPAYKGLLTAWAAKQQNLDSIISILPEEIIKEELAQKFILLKK